MTGCDKAWDKDVTRLGPARSFAFLQSKTLLFALLALEVGFMLDAAVGQYQTYRLDQKRFARLELQHAAFEGLFVEVETVTYEPDGKSFRLRMKFIREGAATICDAEPDPRLRAGWARVEGGPLP